jgi:hypothetical protein
MIKHALRWVGVMLAWTALSGCSVSSPSKPIMGAYEPAVVAVDGMLQRDTTGAFLVTLEQPMDLPDAAAGHDSPNVAERGIRVVQLVGDPKALAALGSQRVHVEGTLSHGANVHQAAAILLTVQRLAPTSTAR